MLSKTCYSGQFLAERTVTLGFPAGLLIALVYLLFAFICEAAKKTTSSTRKGMVADMTKLLKSIRETLDSVCKYTCNVFHATVWAVGAEVAAATF